MRIEVDNPTGLIDCVAIVFETNNCIILDVLVTKNYPKLDGYYSGPYDEHGVYINDLDHCIKIFTGENFGWRVMAHTGKDYVRICYYKDKGKCKIVYSKEN